MSISYTLFQTSTLCPKSKLDFSNSLWWKISNFSLGKLVKNWLQLPMVNFGSKSIFLALKFNYLIHFIIQKYLPILGLKIQKDFFSNKMWDPNLVGDDVLFKTLWWSSIIYIWILKGKKVSLGIIVPGLMVVAYVRSCCIVVLWINLARIIIRCGHD